MDEGVDNCTRRSPGSQHHDVCIVDDWSVRVDERRNEPVAVRARALEHAVAHQERIDRFGSLGRITAHFTHGIRDALQGTRHRQRIELRAEEIAQVVSVLERHLDATRGAAHTRETESRLM
jgi:hypothetical protein